MTADKAKKQPTDQEEVANDLDSPSSWDQFLDEDHPQFMFIGPISDDLPFYLVSRMSFDSDYADLD